MAAPYVGLNECAEHSVAGSAYAAFDKVESGGLWAEGGDPAFNIGVGGQVLKYRDMYGPQGTANCALQTIGLLAQLKPAAIGSLPPIIEKIRGGPLVDANAAAIEDDCYLRSVRLAAARGGLLMVTYDWLALSYAGTTIASAAAKQTNTGFPWHGMDILFSGLDYYCQSWAVTFTNEITHQTSLDTKSAASQRKPQWIDPGNFSAALEAVVRVPWTHSEIADVPAAIGFKVTALNSDPSAKQFTLDMTGGNGLNASFQRLALVAGGAGVTYAIRATSEPNDLSIVSFTLG